MRIVRLLLGAQRGVEERQRIVDRRFVRRGAGDIRRTDGDRRVPRERAFGEEVVVADMRQRREVGSRNQRRGDFAIGRGRGDLVGVAEEDSDRGPHALEAFRIEALDQSRGHHEGGFDAGDAEIVLDVGKGGSDGWLGEKQFCVGAREHKLLLWRISRRPDGRRRNAETVVDRRSRQPRPGS